MDLNYLLIWFVAASCILMLVQAVRARRRGWVVTFLLVLGLTAGSFAWLPDVGGYIGGGALTLLVLTPLFGYRLVLRYTLDQHYARACRIATVLGWLHPADGWREFPVLLTALGAREPATLARTVEVLQRRDASRTGIGRLGVALLFRLENRWEELLDWLQQNLTGDELSYDTNMGGLYLRAHGELDDPNGLLEAFARLAPAAGGAGPSIARHLFRLMALAFCGRRDHVGRLFHGPLGFYPQPVRRFWLATADMASGNVAGARDELESIRDQADPLTAAGIDRRLAHALPVAEQVLTPESREILARAEAELEQEERFSPRARLVRRRACATYALIAANLAVFLLEVALGGATDEGTLYRMGALWPAAVLSGQWWRVCTALFLHYGFVHLLVNMIGLLILGPFLEFALGTIRYLLSYLIAGAGSMLVIVAIVELGHLEEHIVVGASGAIMGLVGATGAVLLRGWMRERARVASRRLVVLAFVIAFQVVFDLVTPQVSFTAHFSGVLIGFLAALLMRDRLAPRSAPGTRAS